MKKLLVINAGLTALLGSGIAHAGFSPYYVGAGVGSASNNGSDTQFCPECAGSQLNIQKKSGLQSLWRGQFNRQLSN